MTGSRRKDRLVIDHLDNRPAAAFQGTGCQQDDHYEPNLLDPPGMVAHIRPVTTEAGNSMGTHRNRWQRKIGLSFAALATMLSSFALAPMTPAAAHGSGGAAPFPSSSPGNNFGYWYQSNCLAAANTWLMNDGNGHNPSNTTVRAGFTFNRTGYGQSGRSWDRYPGGGTYIESNSEIRFETTAAFSRLSSPGLYTRGEEHYTGVDFYRVQSIAKVQPSSTRRYDMRDQYFVAQAAGGTHLWHTYNNGALQVAGGSNDPARTYRGAGYSVPWVQDTQSPVLYRPSAPAIEITPVSSYESNSGAADDRFTRTVNSAGIRRTFTDHRYWRVQSYGKETSCNEGGTSTGSSRSQDSATFGNQRYCGYDVSLTGAVPDFNFCRSQRDNRRSGDSALRGLSAREADWWIDRAPNYGAAQWDGAWVMYGTRPLLFKYRGGSVYAFNRLQTDTSGNPTSSYNGQGRDGSPMTSNGTGCPGVSCPGNSGYLGWSDAPSGPSYTRGFNGTHGFRNWLDIEWTDNPGLRRFQATFRDATWFDDNNERTSSPAYNGPDLYWDNHAPEFRDLPGYLPGETVAAFDEYDGTSGTEGQFRFVAQTRDANMPVEGSGIYGTFMYYRAEGSPAGAAWQYAGLMSQTATGNVYYDTQNHEGTINFPYTGGPQLWDVQLVAVDQVGNQGSATTVTVEDLRPRRPIARPDSAAVDTSNTVDIDVLANDENPNETDNRVCPRYAGLGFCELDEDSIQFPIEPSEGEVSIIRLGPGPDDVRVRYDPYPWASGRDYFTYTVALDDNNFRSQPAGVSITINDGEPVAGDDSDTVNDADIIDGDAFIDVLLNDNDPDGDIAQNTIQIVSTTNGVTAIASTDTSDGRRKVRITGLPAAGARNGSVTYMVCDARAVAWLGAGFPSGWSAGAGHPWPSAANDQADYCDTATIDLVFRILAPT